MTENPSCPKCGSSKVQKRGIRNDKQAYWCRDCDKWFSTDPSEDVEMIIENTKLAKAKQKYQDINRIERKSFREYARVENALSALGEAIKDELKNHAQELKKINLSPLKHKKSGGVGVVHITDPHGNELINLPHNKNDFNILSKRMKLYINESLKFFHLMDVKKVLFVLGGDMLNSDRRVDEILNAATNRARASILMQHILKQAILEVRNSGYEVDVISVLGNEARIGDEMPFSAEGLSENYDFIIASQLKELFEFAGIKGIRFLSIDKIEEKINVNGQTWLVSHDVSKYTDKQGTTQATIGRYSLQGTPIDFVLGGHIHATRITDFSSRGSSMAGSNSYNEFALNLLGRASATCYVVRGGRRYVLLVDLQDVTGIDGYNIVNKLEEYHAKSVGKLHTKEIIHQVVI